MIDYEKEQLLSLTEATKLFPKRPHISTLYRWRYCGIRGVQLETVVIGGRVFTSREAVHRFLEATNAPSGCKTPNTKSVARVDDAEAFLGRDGI